MALQVFIQNPDSGEPWALCGSPNDDKEFCGRDLAAAIGHFALAEIEGAVAAGEKEFTLDIKIKEMTAEEVAALPDI